MTIWFNGIFGLPRRGRLKVNLLADGLREESRTVPVGSPFGTTSRDDVGGGVISGIFGTSSSIDERTEVRLELKLWDTMPVGDVEDENHRLGMDCSEMGCACEDRTSVGSLESPLAGVGCDVGVSACTRGVSGGVGGIGGIGVEGASCSSGGAWITFWVAVTTLSFPFLREIDRNQEERSGAGCNAGVDVTLPGLGGGGGEVSGTNSDAGEFESAGFRKPL